MATRAAAISSHVLPSTPIYSNAAAKIIPVKIETQMRKGQIKELKNRERSLVMLLTGKKDNRKTVVLLLCLQKKRNR